MKKRFAGKRLLTGVLATSMVLGNVSPYLQPVIVEAKESDNESATTNAAVELQATLKVKTIKTKAARTKENTTEAELAEGEFFGADGKVYISVQKIGKDGNPVTELKPVLNEDGTEKTELVPKVDSEGNPVTTLVQKTDEEGNPVTTSRPKTYTDVLAEGETVVDGLVYTTRLKTEKDGLSEGETVSEDGTVLDSDGNPVTVPDQQVTIDEPVMEEQPVMEEKTFMEAVPVMEDKQVYYIKTVYRYEPSTNVEGVTASVKVDGKYKSVHNTLTPLTGTVELKADGLVFQVAAPTPAEVSTETGSASSSVTSESAAITVNSAKKRVIYANLKNKSDLGGTYSANVGLEGASYKWSESSEYIYMDENDSINSEKILKKNSDPITTTVNLNLVGASGTCYATASYDVEVRAASLNVKIDEATMAERKGYNSITNEETGVIYTNNPQPRWTFTFDANDHGISKYIFDQTNIEDIIINFTEKRFLVKFSELTEDGTYYVKPSMDWEVNKNTKYASFVYDSSAPEIGTLTTTTDPKSDIEKIKITGVKDGKGSGTDKVYAVLSDGTEIEMQRSEKYKSVYTCTVSRSEHPNVTVQIKTTDKLGNSKTYDEPTAETSAVISMAASFPEGVQDEASGKDYFQNAVPFTVDVKGIDLSAVDDTVTIKITHADDTVTEHPFSDLDWTYSSKTKTSTATVYITDDAEAVEGAESKAVIDGITDEIKSVTADAVYTTAKSEKTISCTNPVDVNAIIDTITPEVAIAVDAYAFTSEDGKLFLHDNKNLVTRDEETETVEGEYPITFSLKIDDTNFNYEAYEQALKSVDPSAVYSEEDNTFTFVVNGTTDEVTEIVLKLPAIADRAANGIRNRYETINLEESQIAPDAEITYAVEKAFTVNEDNTLETSFNIDAQTPYNGSGEGIMFNIETSDNFVISGVNDLKTFTGATGNDSIDFHVSITDGEGAGIRNVSYKVKDDAEGFKDSSLLNGDITESALAGVYSASLGQMVADKEIDEIKLYVTALDKLGNSRTGILTFNIDTAAPQVDFTRNVTSGTYTVDNKEYSKKKIKYTITVTDHDLNTLDSLVKATITDRDPDENLLSYDEKTGKYIATFTLKDTKNDCLTEGDIFTALTAKLIDKAGNYSKIAENDVTSIEQIPLSQKDGAQEITYAGNPVVIDETKPVIEMSKDIEPVRTVDGVDYYDADVTFSGTVKDIHLNVDKDVEGLGKSSVTAHAVINGNSESPKTITLTHDEKDESGVYHYSFTLTDTEKKALVKGDTLDKLEIYAIDYAANEEKDSYVGNSLCVDEAAPEITVTVPDANHVNAKGNTLYFNADQTISVEVRDINLNNTPKESYVTYKENGSPVTYGLTNAGNGKYTWSYNLKEGVTISDLQVHVTDKALHVTENTKHQQKSYILDKTAPTVDVQVTGNGITNYFTNNGFVYIKFADPAKGESGQGASSGSTKNVTFTAKVSDRNIETNTSAGYESKDFYVTNNLQDGNAWSGNLQINKESTATFTKTINVHADTSGTIKVDLKIKDLCGNKANGYTTGTSDLKELKAFTLEDGKLTGRVTVDQERPSSINNEHSVPEIKLTPNSGHVATVTNSAGKSVNLYSGSMSYAMTVYDPIYTDDGAQLYSGLANVKWTVESDKAGLIATSGNDRSFGGEQSANLTIPVSIVGTGETNNITVSITVSDKAGNEITYKEYLAIDNQAPRVKVVYNNNSAQNSKYFKADRVATITVEDLNFDVSKTSFNTQGSVSGWSQNGNVHTATVSFTKDGDYTFEMATTDKANNKATIDYTNGGSNAVPQAFTIDKTVPVITVSFDNNSSKNGKYYKEDRNATVHIVEHNFNPSEVKTTLTAKLNGNAIDLPAVGSFNAGGDSHDASIAFNKDGDYTITVNYTDLAGNPAQVVEVPEFVIDKTKPTAKFTGVESGKAYTGSITPVLTMNDINMDASGYSVKWNVQRLNETKTLDGLNTSMATKSVTDGGQTVTVNFLDLQKIVSNDGIYKISATITDLAGNVTTTDEITYSVNRFGSVYSITDKDTLDLLNGVYTQDAPKILINEINPNKLKEFSVTISVNGSTKTLKEGADFTVNEVKTDNAWHEYQYIINPKAFMNGDKPVQGGYEITLLSEDEAGNKNSNRTNVDEKNKSIGETVSFTLDNETPTGYIDVTGLEEGKDSIQAAETDVTVHWEDNIAIGKVEIYQNGQVIETLTEDALLAANGAHTVKVKESNEEIEIYAVLTDMAGNATELDKVSFYLNSSWFQQYLHNTPVFVGSLCGIAAVIALLAFLFAKRKKKDEKAA